MNTQELRAKLRDEIRDIPDSRLQEVFDLVHDFRLGLQQEQATRGADIMRFAGVWETMDDFDGFMEELRERRHTAFKTRRQDESGAD